MEETQPVACRFNVHDFSEVLQNKVVNFHVIKMKDSCFIWIGNSPATLANLAVAMKTKYDVLPTTTSALGDTTDMSSSCLALRLSKKCEKAMYVSYNLPSDPLLLSLVEKRLFDEISFQPDKF
jgi:hypothetical protein